MQPVPTETSCRATSPRRGLCETPAHVMTALEAVIQVNKNVNINKWLPISLDGRIKPGHDEFGFSKYLLKERAGCKP
jgi:hypothetical protein